jgi:hypothetical protein
MRNALMCQTHLGIQKTACHSNLESCNAQYGNASEKFRNTERSFSQEFEEL